jgi:hypothetical protein
MGLGSSGIAIGFSRGALERDLNAGDGSFKPVEQKCEVTVYSDGTSQSLSYWVTVFGQC